LTHRRAGRKPDRKAWKRPDKHVARALRSLCVFCGSNAGTRPAYAAAARLTGEQLAASGIRVIYGGGSVGLMGILADSALAAGGEVIGIIPAALDRREIAHRDVSELRVVASMHERKALMNELADGFLALPGGFGTFEELLEMLTWGQLGIHAKPVGLLNVAGFFDLLMRFLDHAVSERFLHPDHRALLLVDAEPAALLGQMRAFAPPATPKWLAPGEE
jgi:uncharacterized protein (TIGR00730 family)